MFFQDSDSYAGPKRKESKPRELLAEHLTPSSQYVLNIPLDEQRWEIRATATIGDERILVETPSLHIYGLNILEAV